jgi:hypothetical protein
MEKAMEAINLQSNDWENRMTWKGTFICKISLIIHWETHVSSIVGSKENK